MSAIIFRPYHGDDREERLESEALHAALEPALPGQVQVSDVVPEGAKYLFGRLPRYAALPRTLVYPGPEHNDIPYWKWDAFLNRAERGFWTLPLEQAEEKVAAIHDAGGDAFVKSTRPKHYVGSVPRGSTLLQELDALVYSFIDGGPALMVQEHVEITSEYRIFVVDGVAITGSGKVMAHTPQDNPGMAFTSFVPDRFHGPTSDEVLVNIFRNLADKAIAEIPARDYALDMALIDGRPGIVEANPLHLGQTGLFACDVARLVNTVLASCGLTSRPLAA